jgi:hypothetical protein
MNKQISDNKKNLFKYLLIGLIVAIAARYIPKMIITNEEIIIIGSIASITYAILDMYLPTIKVNLD